MSGDSTDDKILAAMLADAEKLCGSDDALMQGQYRYLRDRIRALIEMRLCVSDESGMCEEPEA